ncbi:MAG: LPS export ABC transporter periplasmic protein LptC [Treponema sp.]|nr:LPS export ABC transporter periplasmic protein LptC [Treponema sp.]
MKKIKSAARGAVCKLILLVSILFLLESCTFDYGESSSSDSNLPDLVMENVDYVRVRAADPIARFQAERAERYEKQGLMKLQNFSFEQYGERGAEVNASGHGGKAEVEIESGDIQMTNGVRLEVESEDIILETTNLAWKDEPRLLSTGTEDEVNVYRENGTSFTGIGLSADARRRTFEFTSYVSGTYIHDDDDAQESTTLNGEDE